MERIYRILTSLVPVKCYTTQGKILFHASSIGEVNAIYPLVKKFKDYKLSVFTSAGYKYALSLGLNAIRFPLDNPRCLNRILDDVKVVIIAETEIWPNLISISKEKGIPVFIVNGTLSDESFRTYKFIPLIRKTLNKVDMVICQSERDRYKYEYLGAKNVKVVGNLKFDSVERPVKDIHFKHFDAKNSFLFANVRGREIKTIISAIKEVLNQMPVKFIIAPRHLENVAKIAKNLKRTGIKFSLRSRDSNADVLILDTLGELWSIYRFCRGCFVGGSLWRYGGHSLIEPAYWKLPTSTGRFVHKQPYAYDMIKEGVVYLIDGENDLVKFIIRVYEDEDFAETMSQKIYEFYLRHKGISEKVYAIISSALK